MAPIAGALAFLLSIGAASGEALQPTGHSQTVAEAYAPYYEGDAVAARQRLEALAAQSRDPVEKAESFLALVTLCLRIADTACSAANSGSFNALLDSGEPAFETAFSGPITVGQFLSIQASPWALYEMWLNGDGDLLPDLDTVTSLNTVHKYFFWPESYLALQGVLITEYSDRGDFNAARRAISKLTKFVVDRRLHDAAAISDFMLARYLGAIIAGLHQVGDSTAAAQYVQRFDTFILRHLPAGGFERVQYLLVSSEIMAGLNDVQSFARAVERLELAAASASNAEIDSNIRDDNLAIIRATQATYCVIAPEACVMRGAPLTARQVHSKNPHFANRENIKSRPYFATMGTFLFAVADVLVAQSTGGAVDPDWELHFSKRLAWEVDSESGRGHTSLRLFAKSLIAASTGSGDPVADLTKAAAMRINALEKRLSGRSGFFPLPDYADLAIVAMALDMLAKRDRLTTAQKTLALKGIELLQRTARHSRGDALSFVAGLKSESVRRHAQALLQLRQRRHQVELRALELLVSGGNRKSIEALSRSIFLLAHEESRALPAIDAARDEGVKDDELPGLETIRTGLAPAEAVVVNAVARGSLYRLCLTRDGFDLSSTAVARENLLDGKILRAALTATHGPSEKLDAQFPAKAAVRMKRHLLGGLDSCLRDARLISYIPDARLADLPLQALLENVPQSHGDGYDLSGANWLLKRFDISNAFSVQEFVAARATAAHAGGALPFLGIGDPVLAAPIAEDRTGGEIAALRSAATPARTLTALPELPETGVELRAVAEMMPGAKLLTRENASESAVRAEPLSEYNIISFATHGIVQGELAGIADAGLVLTPDRRTLGDPLADGFLSATELAGIKLNARLVVLSACNTANFETGLFANGMRGLTASLAISGVPTVLASLWPVDSVTGKQVVVRFFRKVTSQPDRPASTALAQAVRSFVENPPRAAYSHPRFWAPFVVIGDGIVAPGRANRIGGARLSRFTVDLGDPGGFADFAVNAKVDLFLSRRSSLNGGTITSSVESRAGDGKPLWKVEKREIGAGPIDVAGDRVYAAGYRANADATRIVPVLQAFYIDGRPAWKWEADLSDGESAMILDIAANQDDLWVLEQRKGIDPPASMGLYRFGRDGELHKRWTIPLPDGVDTFRSGRVATLGDGAVAFFRIRPDYRHASTLITDFGDGLLCPAEGGSLMHVLRSPDDDPSSAMFLSGLTIKDAEEDDGAILIAGGMRTPCDPADYAYFGRVEADGSLQTIYREADMYRTSFIGFSRTGSRILLAGEWLRRYSENLEYPSLRELLDGVAYYRSTDDYQFVETFLLELRHDAPSARHFVTAGTSTSSVGLHFDDDRAWLAGSVGDKPMSAEIELPPNP